MRVALLTTGRFTLVDLARELVELGHHPLVYSLVPPWVTRRFGLPDRCNRWLAPYLAPIYATARAAARLPKASGLEPPASHMLVASLDALAARFLEPCDIVVGMSGIALRTVEAAHRRYGATVFLERSSRHILSQREILEAIPGLTNPVPEWCVYRELAGYGLADLVSVPSSHVMDSFIEYGFPADRMFLNPFGTGLDQFRPTASPEGAKTVLTTGAWSRQKGCDVLVDAWRRLPAGTRLLHVGPVVDVPLPSGPGFEHVDAVPQSRLPEYYARAHVFALASRQDGLAVVQLQALACGLPLVCTTRTGGADLARWVASPNAIRVVPPDDPASLAGALADALRIPAEPGQLRDLLGARRGDTSWRAYAERYSARMEEARSHARLAGVARPPGGGGA
jgi:starch synthase